MSLQSYTRVFVLSMHLSRIQQKGPAVGKDTTNSFASLYEPTSVLTPLHRRELEVGIARSLSTYGLGFFIGRYRGMAE